MLATSNNMLSYTHFPKMGVVIIVIVVVITSTTPPKLSFSKHLDDIGNNPTPEVPSGDSMDIFLANPYFCSMLIVGKSRNVNVCTTKAIPRT